MIEIINIMPKIYLYKFYLTNDISTSMHMAMAHLVLEDDEYSKWSKEQKKLGKYVILDNSAPYFGEALDADSLLRCIDIINPDEVILPDIIGNFKETVRRSLEFLDKMGNRETLKVMAVPQGDSLERYIECHNIFSSDERIKVIGLSYTLNNLFSNEEIPPKYISSREYLVSLLYEMNIMNSDKEHHLLGFSDLGHVELERLRRFSFIRSCDSSTAYITAKQNVEIVKDAPYKKPEVSINFDDDFDGVTYDLAVKNTKTLAEAGGYRK